MSSGVTTVPDVPEPTLTLAPNTTSVFETLYNNRIYIYVVVIILLLVVIGYHLYNKYKQPASIPEFEKVHEEFKPTMDELQQLKKLNDLNNMVEPQQPRNQQMPPQPTEFPQQQYYQQQQKQQQQQQKQSKQKVVQSNSMENFNNNDRIKMDMHEPLVNELGEDENVQNYDLSQGEINELTKELDN
jgi:hypothetical protein